MDAAIRIREVTRRFGAITAVDRLSLEVAPGEIFGLVGPDGAGKTTTMRLLCGLLSPDQGEIRMSGLDVAQEVDAVRDRIGYMAQRFGLYADLTVDENMGFYADLFGIGRAERGGLIPGLLRMTRMEPFRERAAGKLSGGMKQKLALMCTLLHRPEILLLDEPTTGVDPVSRRDFWAILYQLVKEGLTVMVATAYLDEAERCNRVGLMHRGRLVHCDAPDVLRRTPQETCYEVLTGSLPQAREVLAAVPGVISVEPSGAALHLFLSPGTASVADMEEELVRRGLPPPQFRKIVPSLEDVFIVMIQKSETKNLTR
ncbi:MAG: ABC transporter ATP-binding protein [Acidobacteria bacterium]|nr:ABC transporter ATP-binding protein [Acidobacteriota bacterium]